MTARFLRKRTIVGHQQKSCMNNRGVCNPFIHNQDPKPTIIRLLTKRNTIIRTEPKSQKPTIIRLAKYDTTRTALRRQSFFHERAHATVFYTGFDQMGRGRSILGSSSPVPSPTANLSGRGGGVQKPAPKTFARAERTLGIGTHSLHESNSLCALHWSYGA